MDKHIFYAENLTSGYDGKIVVDDVSIAIPDGKISVILGANASGKSTLLKTLVRLIKPIEGAVKLDGSQIDSVPSRKLARTIGFLPQSPIVPEGIVVADLVGRGRFPHHSFLKGWSRKDSEAVAQALDIMGIADLADRSIDELSGGQRQRVWIAMALAQQTDILMLDEPTTYLDITYQVEILDLLTDLNRRTGTTIVMVLHDINLSARYADHLFVMRAGRLIAEGSPQEVITSKLVKAAFSLESDIYLDPISGSPMLVPKGRHHARRNRNAQCAMYTKSPQFPANIVLKRYELSENKHVV